MLGKIAIALVVLLFVLEAGFSYWMINEHKHIAFIKYVKVKRELEICLKEKQ
jgi:hypothetical protein